MTHGDDETPEEYQAKAPELVAQAAAIATARAAGLMALRTRLQMDDGVMAVDFCG